MTPAPIALTWQALCATPARKPDPDRAAAARAAVAELAADFGDVYRGGVIAVAINATDLRIAAMDKAIDTFNHQMRPLLPDTPHPAITTLAHAVARVRACAGRAFGAPAATGSRDAWARATSAAIRDLELAAEMAIGATDSPPQE